MRLEKWTMADELCLSLLEEGIRELMGRMFRTDSVLFATTCSTEILLLKLSTMLASPLTRQPKVLALRGEFEKTSLGMVVQLNVTLLSYQNDLDNPTVLVRGKLLDLREFVVKVETHREAVKALDCMIERCVYTFSKGFAYAIQHDEKMFVRVFQKRKHSVSFSVRGVVRRSMRHPHKWRRWRGWAQKRLVPRSNIEYLASYMKQVFEMAISAIVSTECASPSSHSKVRKALKEISDILFQSDLSVHLCRTLDGQSDCVDGRTSWRFIRLRLSLQLEAHDLGSEPIILYENQWNNRSIPNSEKERAEIVEELTEAMLKKVPSLVNLSFIKPEFLDDFSIDKDSLSSSSI